MNIDGRYLIMHEDTCIGLISILNSSISNVLVNMKCADCFPVGYEISNKGLVKWLENRGIPATRQGLKVDLGTMTRFEYMVLNLGLSLSDHYWIKPEESYSTWGSINLYSNLFKATLSLDIDKYDISGKTNFVPSSSLKGDLRKKWIIDTNGVRRLVKGNYNNSCRQSISEVFATKIHELQNSFCFTPYNLIKLSYNDTVVLGCECPNFTSLYTEFISAYDLLNMPECKRAPKKRSDMNWYEYYVQYMSSFGLDIRNFMDYMFMTDFI